jgi:hypothetical protein
MLISIKVWRDGGTYSCKITGWRDCSISAAANFSALETGSLKLEILAHLSPLRVRHVAPSARRLFGHRRYGGPETLEAKLDE